MAVLGQRSHHDVGDVIGVDERLLHIADRQRNTACENLIEPGALTEVLREEGARTIVQSSPDALTTSSARAASTSLRPDSSTSLLTPARWRAR